MKQATEQRVDFFMKSKKTSEDTAFPNAPITEAILDIRAELPEKIKLEDLATFQNHIRDRFPKKKERLSADIQFSQEKGVSGTPPKTEGYLFYSDPDSKVVQARLDGFTFNKLKPYENWETFCREGFELWKLYSLVAQPTKVIRIALRYINRIEIPLTSENLEEYILTLPKIASALPQELGQFLLRLVIPNTKIGANAIITLVLEKATDQGVPLIFDIDVSRDLVYVNNSEKIWSDFEKLRIFKNEIFSHSLTDKAKEMFK